LRFPSPPSVDVPGSGFSAATVGSDMLLAIIPNTTLTRAGLNHMLADFMIALHYVQRR
jgi:hypothetical protein